MTVQVWYSKIQFYGLTDKQTLSFVLQLYILSNSQDLVVRLVSFLFSLSFYFLF